MESFFSDVSNSLTEREKSVVSISNISVPTFNVSNFRLLCRIYSNRGYNPKQLKIFILKPWIGRFQVTISDYETNSYMVTFGCECDMKRVLFKEPWHFHNQPYDSMSIKCSIKDTTVDFNQNP
ncbi:hypothetical protein F8388_021326 [Cannabis sativa]|uniref:DUF4283 domain-containing protein n=1 Tax=Cannabis sativa TaxID=3483 RepID=A0A7J6GFR8_CANSA|nr:hypothetical protein G4B88_025801 [Cannabis sativa]KAF4381698.1 hypothetical protein F8388_021326 [Cannabis sativa]